MSLTDSPADLAAPRVHEIGFAIRRLGERMAVIDAGEWLDERRTRRFARAVLDATADGVREIVLDLSRVRYHVWPALYALCELEARLSESCCEPVAAAADPSLLEDLHTVGLDRAWSVSPTLPEALADLLGRAPA
jgi:anti-anti-sigma regulatory factor